MSITSRIINFYFFFLACAYSTIGQAEQIYKWTDNNGNVHYSTN
ncbi:MAG: DUF4124 domain-containing protein, partial [SAR324 cluster bacterium]|nr:DUF4124 domain-containing protein [SAR324 cluster bacterium]